MVSDHEGNPTGSWRNSDLIPFSGLPGCARRPEFFDGRSPSAFGTPPVCEPREAFGVRAACCRFGLGIVPDSGSKLRALQTLREIRAPSTNDRARWHRAGDAQHANEAPSRRHTASVMFREITGSAGCGRGKPPGIPIGHVVVPPTAWPRTPAPREPRTPTAMVRGWVQRANCRKPSSWLCRQ